MFKFWNKKKKIRSKDKQPSKEISKAPIQKLAVKESAVKKIQQPSASFGNTKDSEE
jgi:histone H3/H4